MKTLIAIVAVTFVVAGLGAVCIRRYRQLHPNFPGSKIIE